MTNRNYSETIVKQSQVKFSLMKEKMLQSISEVQKARKENLRELLIELEKKQSLIWAKKVSLESLFRK